MPAGVYVHVELLRQLPSDLRELAARARAVAARRTRSAFNVVKFMPDGRVGLLSYPGFFREPFPALSEAATVDVRTGAVTLRRYGRAGNPPILHRKELLLPSSHTGRSRYAALTAAAEAHGLFRDAHKIGHRREWAARLQRARLRLDGHRLTRAT